jgi:hypothetical protein
MEVDDNEDEDRASVVSSHSRSISISAPSIKDKVKAKADPEEDEKSSTKKLRPAKRQRTRTTKKQKADEDEMDVDPSLPTPVHPSPPKSPCRKSTIKTSPPLSKSSSKPKSIVFASTKPKSIRLQGSPLSSSFTPGTTDVKSPLPRPESPTRKVRVEVQMLTTAGRKGLLTKGSMGSLKERSSVGSIKVASNAESRVGNKPKALDEIVDTSVDGEVAFS